MTSERRTRFLVVGSGAGGAVIAHHLAVRGEPVLLVERGPWVRPEAMDHDERRMLGLLYKDAGAQTTSTLDMYVLQASCVGGSTVVANGACLRMPEAVRRRWAADGLEIPREDLDASFDRVERGIGVRPMDSRVANPAAERFERGARSVGLAPGRLRKNIRRCTGCGFCNLGCADARKQDAAQTWIARGVGAGLEVLPDTEALRIVVRRGRVDHVLCRRRADGGFLRIVAERTVLCGGAVNTPEVLLRSGLGNGAVGRGTAFNAGAMLVAEYPDDVDAFRGDQMGWYVHGEGWLAEQDHQPPMTFALTLGGASGLHHARLGAYRRLTSAGVVVPTPAVGRVRLPLSGRWGRAERRRALIDFRMPEASLEALRRGFGAVARAFLASGAVAVHLPVFGEVVLRRPQDADHLARWIPRASAISGLGTAHPQGGCAAGGDARRHPVDPSFRLRGVEDLYVCDASVFPSGVEVNPQLSVMAVADHAAQAIGGFRHPPALAPAALGAGVGARGPLEPW